MATATAYADALEFLFPRVTTIKFGLDTTRTLLAAVGDPHLMIPRFTSAGPTARAAWRRLDRVGAAARWAGGSGCTPRRIWSSFRERIRVDGVPISEEAVAMWTARLRPLIERARRDLLRGHHRDRLRRLRCARGGDRRGGGGAGRPARQHQRAAAAGQRGHQDRARPHEVPGRHAGADRGGEGGDRQAGCAVRDRRGAIRRSSRCSRREGAAVRQRGSSRAARARHAGPVPPEREWDGPRCGSQGPHQRRNAARGAWRRSRRCRPTWRPDAGAVRARLRRRRSSPGGSTGGAGGSSTWRTIRTACGRWWRRSMRASAAAAVHALVAILGDKDWPEMLRSLDGAVSIAAC